MMEKTLELKVDQNIESLSRLPTLNDENTDSQLPTVTNTSKHGINIKSSKNAGVGMNSTTLSELKIINKPNKK